MLISMLAPSLLIGILQSVSVAPADGALAFAPCASNAPAGFSCTAVPVPLDRRGQVPGTISLSVERKLASPIQSKAAVLALAGGPGQAALGLGEFITKALAPALTARDLLLFDQRGTGASGPLNCSTLNSFSGTASQAFEHCALQIGPARGAYTTQESVADIEAIRQAAGYEKLVLYGTSYGTKVAEQYAERYPQHVEALVLDSVVPPDGPEPFSIPTFQAIGSVLGELCSKGACTAITPNPLTDIASLAARLRKHPVSGSVYDGSGHRHTATLAEPGLLGILESGDLNPALRALLPAAVRSALRNDPDPLLRLQLLAEGLIPNRPGGHPSEENSDQVDEALFVTTTCEEAPFPWQRSGAPATRLAEARGALSALPGSDFYPFDARTAFENSLIPACAGWPDASAASVVPGALPDVPALILSGAQDLRTPTSGARRVAALIPGAQLLVVPFTGHSVIGSDFSGCATQAVTAFFGGGVGGHPIPQCAPSPDVFAPTPLTPTKLAYVHPAPGLSGRPALTLTAVLDTIIDLNRQVIGATLQANAQLPSGSSFGGLRGGEAKLSSSRLQLTRFTFVPGVQLSGTFPVRKGRLQSATLRISGAAAANGTVHVGSGKQITGSLGGKRFDVNIAQVRRSRAGSSQAEWPSHPVTFPLPALAGLR